MRELQLQARKPGGKWGVRNRFGTHPEGLNGDVSLEKAKVEARRAKFGWERLGFGHEFRIEVVPYVPPKVVCPPLSVDLDAYRRWVARREDAREDEANESHKHKRNAKQPSRYTLEE